MFEQACLPVDDGWPWLFAWMCGRLYFGFGDIEESSGDCAPDQPLRTRTVLSLGDHPSRNLPEQALIHAFGEDEGEFVYEFIAHLFGGEEFVFFEEAEF